MIVRLALIIAASFPDDDSLTNITPWQIVIVSSKAFWHFIQIKSHNKQTRLATRFLHTTS